MEFVSWDDDIPNIWKVIKFMFQITNQIPSGKLTVCELEHHHF